MKTLKLSALVFFFIIGTNAGIFGQQRQSLFDYYLPNERSLNQLEQTQHDQLLESGFYTAIRPAIVRDLGSIKEGQEFDVNYDGLIHTAITDFLTTKANGEYQVSAVIGSDTGSDGFTNFTCNYSIDYGVSGQIINDISKTYLQIIPIIRPEGDPHINPEVFVCTIDPTRYKNNNSCGTPTDEPDNGEVDDEDLSETRSNCSRTIRVLFLFSNAAPGSGLNVPAVANSVISELNNAVNASEGFGSLSVARYENAGTFNLPNFMPTADMGADLNALVDNATAQQLRNANLADLVVLLTNNPLYTLAGKAKDIKTSDENAYSIAQIRFAAFGFTASHEIGHMMGCRHQRCSTCGGGFLGLTSGCDEWGRGHGFTLCATGRTIMYQNGCDSRTRLGRFSNQDSDFMGCSSGNWWNNNIRSMRNHACTVGSFRSAPVISKEFSMNIFGLPFNCQSNNSVWTVEIQEEPNSPNNYNYQWAISENGVSNWCTVGTNSSEIDFFTISSSGCLNASQFYLRVTVSTNNDSHVDQMFITIANCADDEDNDEVSYRNNSDEVDNQLPAIYPNPSQDIFHVQTKGQVIGVVSYNGQMVLDKIDLRDDEQQKRIDLSRFPNGIYNILIEHKGAINAHKIIKQGSN